MYLLEPHNIYDVKKGLLPILSAIGGSILLALWMVSTGAFIIVIAALVGAI